MVCVETTGNALVGLRAGLPFGSRLTHVVVPVARLRRKSWNPTDVHGTARFVAEDRKATIVPSALRRGAKLSKLPGLPSGATLTQVVVPVPRFLT
jgi:hypothetical protein